MLRKEYRRKFAIRLFGIICLSMLFNGCSEEQKEEKEELEKTPSTNIIKVDNALFSIPSPMQTSILIKKVGANYRKELTNSVSNNSKYASNFKKALNLGIYGADLGYVTIYDQSQDAVAYLGVITKISNDLGVSGAFDQALINRFQKNMGNKDSLMGMVSLSFRAGNAYLQTNERKDVAALVIAGGYIESLFLTVSLANEIKNSEIISRVGEQKSSLDNLIKLLNPYYQQAEYTEFIDQLIDLAYEFDAIETIYKYVPPSTDEASKTTYINSSSQVIIQNETLTTITQKVKNLRNQIVG